MGEIIDLKDTTFIIPIMIDSQDRVDNLTINLNFLAKNFNTNVIIFELKKPGYNVVDNIIKKLVKNKLKITYLYEVVELTNERPEIIFHRTKYLNMMLNMVKTDFVVNYDVDVLLNPLDYVLCVNKLKDDCDVVYPYFFGLSQRAVLNSGKNKLLESFDLNLLTENDYKLNQNRFGLAQFFKTSVYIEGGMENEHFISYGPEDFERAHRFKVLDYNVEWADIYIYHIEHSRGDNSSNKNPYFSKNNELYSSLNSLSKKELKVYYDTIDYKDLYRKNG
jgi:predicted glycosyltransferase involved in capsule biosynthesis